MVLPLLAEGIRQASESAQAHPDPEIRAFNNRRADPGGIGLTHDWDLLGLHFGRAVPTSRLPSCSFGKP